MLAGILEVPVVRRLPAWAIDWRILRPMRYATGGTILACRMALEHGVHIETGPHKHTIQQSFFLYVWEPAGNRIELDNPAARLVFAPDWEPIDWSEAERAKGQAWGLKTIDSFHTHGTPPVEHK